MRHKNIHRKFGREHQHRMAMLRNQVTSLLTHERIHTTEAKAKEIRGIAEKVITLGKKGDLHARRIAFRTVRDKEVLHKGVRRARRSLPARKRWLHSRAQAWPTFG